MLPWQSNVLPLGRASFFEGNLSCKALSAGKVAHQRARANGAPIIVRTEARWLAWIWREEWLLSAAKTSGAWQSSAGMACGACSKRFRAVSVCRFFFGALAFSLYTSAFLRSSLRFTLF